MCVLIQNIFHIHKENLVFLLEIPYNIGSVLDFLLITEMYKACFKICANVLKNKQTEVNNVITEMKNILEGISSRITVAEERISDLEDRKVEITAMEKNKEKEWK